MRKGLVLIAVSNALAELAEAVSELSQERPAKVRVVGALQRCRKELDDALREAKGEES